MFAVIRTGGKQYKVAANDVLKIERLDAEVGSTVEFGDVLMLGGEGSPVLGRPLVAGATVAAEVLDQVRGERIIVFKKRRRKHYRRRNGHRQLLTSVRITEILTDGRKPTKAKAKAEPEAAPTAEPKPAPDAPEAEAKSGPMTAPQTELRREPEAAPVAKATQTQPSGADDLSLISGVGPKILHSLTDLGYTTFRQIAELTPAQIEEIEAAIKMKGRVTREEWPEQARELMAGRGPRTNERGKPAPKAARKDAAGADETI